MDRRQSVSASATDRRQSILATGSRRFSALETRSPSFSEERRRSSTTDRSSSYAGRRRSSAVSDVKSSTHQYKRRESKVMFIPDLKNFAEEEMGPEGAGGEGDIEIKNTIRHDELIAFIDDFVQSHEYREYIRKKRAIIKKDFGAQFNSEELENSEISGMHIVNAASSKFVEIIAMEKKLKKYVSSKKISKAVEAQEKSIAVIREKIDEAKLLFYCHREERKKLKQERNRLICEKFLSKRNIDVSNIINKQKVCSKVLCCYAAIKKRKSKHHTNYKDIVERLLSEHRYQKRMEKLNRNKNWRPKPKKEVEKDKEVIDERSASYFDNLSRFSTSTELESTQFEDLSNFLFGTDLEGSKPKIHEKKEKAKKIPKQKEKKSPRSESKETKSAKTPKEELFIMPEAPIVNQRLKIKHKNELNLQMKDLIKTFLLFEDLLETRHFISKMNNVHEHSMDDDFVSTPGTISFKGYFPERIYSKKILIVNKCGVPKKIRFVKVETPSSDYKSVFVEVEAKGILVAYPGIPFTLNVYFRPNKETGVVTGNLVFLSLLQSKAAFQKFLVPIECIPVVSDIVITPLKMEFGDHYFWKFKEERKIWRTLKIKNNNDVPHKIIITKVRDQLETTFLKKKQRKFRRKLKKNTQKTQADKDIELMVNALLEDVLEGIQSKFEFEHQFLHIREKGEHSIRIFLRNVTFCGSYYEKYSIQVYQAKEHTYQLVGCQEMVITAEVLEHFIYLKPKVICFGVCFFDTTYQVTFQILNSTKHTHALSIKVPSILKEHIFPTVNDTYIQPDEAISVRLRVLARKSILHATNPYYDHTTNILEFPLKVYNTSKQFLDMPPLHLNVYAILCNGTDLALAPALPLNVTEKDGELELDMGKCSITECICAQFQLRNNTHCALYYCFVEVPPCIEIDPNQLTGILQPFTYETLDVYFCPQINDIWSVPEGGKWCHHRDILYKIKVDTLANGGQIKKKFNFKRLNQGLKAMVKLMDETEKPMSFVLYDDIMDCVRAIRKVFDIHNKVLEKQNEIAEVSSTTYASDFTDLTADMIKDENKEKNDEVGVTDLFEGKSQNASSLTPTEPITLTNMMLDRSVMEFGGGSTTNETNLTELPSLTPNNRETTKPSQITLSIDEYKHNYIWIRGYIITPDYQFSEQYVTFPDTPCGSYSLMNVYLKPLKVTESAVCVCGYVSSKDVDFTAKFTITGGNNEIKIEPTYGHFKKDQVVKLTLLAKPEMPQSVIMAEGKRIKYKKMLEEKVEEMKRKKEAEELHGKKRKKEPKKKKKGASADELKVGPDGDAPANGTTANGAKISSSEDIILNYMEVYPAEVNLWRTMESFEVTTKFTCCITYESEKGSPSIIMPDKFQLEAKCTAIKPDFVHDLKVQHIKFGTVPIGTTAKKIIEVTNIQHDLIYPKVTYLSTSGPFQCLNMDGKMLYPEHILKIPVTYTPKKEITSTEYFEIKSEQTLCPLVVSGTGILPIIQISPDSKTYRMECDPNGLGICHVDISNETKCPVTITFEKTYELVEESGRRASTRSSKKSILSSISTSTHTNVGKDKEEDKPKSKKEAAEAKKNNKKINPKLKDLTEEEMQVIKHSSVGVTKDSFFMCTSPSSGTNIVTLNENSKATMTIRFGYPSIFTKYKAELAVQEAKERESPKEKGKKKPKKEKSKETIYGKDKKSDNKWHLIKYNILLGATFLRDITILGSFQASPQPQQ